MKEIIPEIPYSYFNNILATAITSEEAIIQLMNGEVDAIFLYEIGFKWLCDEMGVD